MILSGMIGEKLNVLNAKLGINQNDPEAMLHTTAKNSTDVPIIIDDIKRESERILMEKISEKLNRPYLILEDKDTGVIQ